MFLEGLVNHIVSTVTHSMTLGVTVWNLLTQSGTFSRNLHVLTQSDTCSHNLTFTYTLCNVLTQSELAQVVRYVFTKSDTCSTSSAYARWLKKNFFLGAKVELIQ